MSLVIVDIKEDFYKDSDGSGKGICISSIYKDERTKMTITREKNGMYCLTGKYGVLGWVYPSAIITFL